MLVRMTVAIAGPAYVLDPGDEFHFPQDEALRLVSAGYAVPVAEPKIERAVSAPVSETRGRRGKHVATSDTAADRGGTDNAN